ncbi:MAG: hypothetical protein KAS32_07735 [Candidatus Peribacteraceae bacterium]|nr:hypothetical protein [Candidatus Peribacteraceae bacterium]
MDNNHNINVIIFDDMVESVEFRCGNEIITAGVGDFNIKTNCRFCGRDFTTVGEGASKVILSSTGE